MTAGTVVGAVLLAGLAVFLVGAVRWRLAYERPLAESLRVIADDRSRRVWIHVWMIAGVLLTAAGVGAFSALVSEPPARVAATMAAVVYGMGAACWLVSLAFRLTVIPWAAAETVRAGEPPVGFVALNGWASTLYVLHMATAYAAFGLLGLAVLLTGDLPGWLGWVGTVWGVVFLAGFVATRFAGPFNPPFWAHLYTGLVGALLVLSR